MTKISRFTDPKDPLNKDKFQYKYADGTVVDKPEILHWIKELRIPPAWQQVVIFYNTSGKQTCCGYDPAGRLQCLYSKNHINKAKKQKYCSLIEFGKQLPKIQSDIKRALENKKWTKSKIIALVIEIVTCCSFRLGTLTYEAQNESYGITTIRREHVKFDKNGNVSFSFIGKKGVLNECDVCDPSLSKLLWELCNIKKPDDHVMMYQDGIDWHHIKHTDINNFLKEYGNEITSKDFRTFRANMLFIDHLKDTEDLTKLPVTKRKKLANDVIKTVATEIHNTPTISKKDYIDTDIIIMFIEQPVKYKKYFITPTTSARIKFMNWLEHKCGV